MSAPPVVRVKVRRVRRSRRRRADPVVDAAPNGDADWRARADKAPKMPASDILRALGMQVPDGITATAIVDSTDDAGAAIVLVIRPIPHAAVDTAKGAILALWGRLGSALPYFAPLLAGVPWFSTGGRRG